MVQVSAERDSSNQANIALKAELDRYRDVTGNTVEALEREKAVKAKLETQNKAQVCAASILQSPASTLNFKQTPSMRLCSNQLPFMKLTVCLLQKPAALLLHMQTIGMCLMLCHQLHKQCLVLPLVLVCIWLTCVFHTI